MSIDLPTNSSRGNLPTAKLIESMAAQLQPVAPLASPVKISLRFLSLFLVTATIAAWGLELRGPVSELLNVGFIFDSFLLVVLIFLGVFTLVRLSLPGLTSGAFETLALFAVAMLLLYRLLLLPAAFPDALPADHPGYTCAFPVLIMAVLFGPVIILFARTLAPFRARAITFLAFLASALVGTLILQWVCPGSDILHILYWHYLPALGISTLAASFGWHALRS